MGHALMLSLLSWVINNPWSEGMGTPELQWCAKGEIQIFNPSHVFGCQPARDDQRSSMQLRGVKHQAMESGVSTRGIG